MRRVVTGHDDRGKAVVVSDGTVANVLRPQNRPGVALHNIWQIDSMPAKIHGPEETTDVAIRLTPPKGGSVFRVVDFPPEKDWIDQVDRAQARAAFASMGAEDAADPDDQPPHPLMHRTETIDYAICLEGEIDMVLDDSEVRLKAGDAVVQRGTNHAWSNRGDKLCRIAFVLVDGVFSEHPA